MPVTSCQVKDASPKKIGSGHCPQGGAPFYIHRRYLFPDKLKAPNTGAFFCRIIFCAALTVQAEQNPVRCHHRHAVGRRKDIHAVCFISQTLYAKIVSLCRNCHGQIHDREAAKK